MTLLSDWFDIFIVIYLSGCGPTDNSEVPMNVRIVAYWDLAEQSLKRWVRH
jgi:hypothetical protein